MSYHHIPYVNPEKKWNEDADGLIAELWPNGVEDAPAPVVSSPVAKTTEAEEREWSNVVEIIEAAEGRGLRAPEWAYAVIARADLSVGSGAGSGSGSGLAP